jgi:hypothetical protein
MAVQLASILNGQQFFDNLGEPLAGGLIYAYITGTSTPINTYANADGTVLNTNPLVLDSSGRLQTEIWLQSGTEARFRLTDFASTVLEEWDNISGIITGVDITQADIIAGLGYIPVNKAGDTMLGNLILSGAPTSDNMAATKKYVDDKITTLDTDLKAYVDAKIAAIPSTIAAGTIQSFGFTTPPTGWLVCDGSAVLRTTYATLFAAISTFYGNGDGVNTFNLPDLRGYFPRGFGGVDAGRVFGTTQQDDYRKHDHIHYTSTKANGDSSFSLFNPTYTGGAQGGTGPWVGASGNTRMGYLLVTDVNSQIPARTAANPGTETRPKNLTVQFMIKT